MEATPHRILNWRFCALGTCAALGALLSGLASAQDAPAEPASQLQEVVVTAEYRQEKLQDTPIAISAFTSENIRQQGATVLSDILTNAPSVAFREQSPAFGNSVTAYIRGFGQGDFDPAFSPGVGIYIDDIYYPRLTGANFDLLDVERIEVLRGPQGTLEGRNSEGGAIRILSKKPTADDDAYITAAYGTRNLLQLRAATNITIADHLYARIAGTLADQDGYVDTYSYGCLYPSSGVPAPGGGTKCLQYSMGNTQYRALKGSLRWNPSDAFDAVLSADYIHDTPNNAAEVLLYGYNPNPNVNAPGGVPLDSRFICGKWCNYATLGQTAGTFVGLANGVPLQATAGQQENALNAYDFALNMEAAFSQSVRLTSITGYHNFDNTYSADGDLSPAQTQFGNDEVSGWFWSQELRLNVDFTKSLRATIGGYYSDERSQYYSLQDIRYVAATGIPPFVCPIPEFTTPPAGPACPAIPLQFIQNDPEQSNSKAAYGTMVWDVTEALSLTGGLRYSKDYNAYTYYRYNLDGVTINPFLDPVGAANGAGYNGPNGTALTGSKHSFDSSRTDWHFSADYRFDPAVMAYASAGTGYKAGGVSPRPFNAAQAVPFAPEHLTSYELGLKTDLFDRRVRFNTALFYNNFDDAQIVLLSCPQLGGPGPCAVPQNAGDAKVKGVEVEIFAIPTPGLQLELSGSYLKWDWKCVNPEVVPIAVPGATGCSSDPAIIDQLSGSPIGFIPYQGHFGLQYEIGLGNGSSLTPRFDATYQGPTTGSNQAATPGTPTALYGQVGGYTIADLRLTLTNSKRDVETTLAVTNLFNHYYFNSKFDLTGAGSGTITGVPGAPFGWYLQVRKTFH